MGFFSLISCNFLMLFSVYKVLFKQRTTIIYKGEELRPSRL